MQIIFVSVLILFARDYENTLVNKWNSKKEKLKQNYPVNKNKVTDIF